MENALALRFVSPGRLAIFHFNPVFDVHIVTSPELMGARRALKMKNEKWKMINDQVELDQRTITANYET